MVNRIPNLPEKHSFFLFGARGTGKTTLLNERFNLSPSLPSDTLLIDLLNPDEEEAYSRNPNLLKERISLEPKSFKRVIIDEVQKIPPLLDVVHSCIEKFKHIQFILTGSSARKLKSGGANMLGGRAFSIYLFPFTHLEVPTNHNSLLEILSFGTLPKLYEFSETRDKMRFIKSYAQTYLKQEIQLEHLVRDIVSFREFLELAGQASGEIINFSNIANKSGVDDKTISRYFEILVDTLVGYFLEPFDESVRVRQSQKPKFYFFDTGITRYLNQTLDLQLRQGSSEYGNLFEQFIICECFRLNEYYEKNFKFYYLRTKDNAEIDLIVQKPGKKRILIEIKSADQVNSSDLRHLNSLSANITHKERWVICNEDNPRMTEDGVMILPWKNALNRLFQ